MDITETYFNLVMYTYLHRHKNIHRQNHNIAVIEQTVLLCNTLPWYQQVMPSNLSTTLRYSEPPLTP